MQRISIYFENPFTLADDDFQERNGSVYRRPNKKLIANALMLLLPAAIMKVIFCEPIIPTDRWRFGFATQFSALKINPKEIWQKFGLFFLMAKGKFI
ncbi:MAG: hypothetical protein U0T73_08110 [Chitinophagales bacterium]